MKFYELRSVGGSVSLITVRKERVKEKEKKKKKQSKVEAETEWVHDRNGRNVSLSFGV